MSGVTWGRCAILPKEKGGSKREVKVSLFYLSGVDRILAAWVMAPPIFFIGITGAGGEETMKDQISAF